MLSYEYLEEQIAQINARAKLKHKKFSFAESCTGGLLCALCTSQSGSSEVFDGGVISYSNRIKHQLLDVSIETLDKYGAVSEQTTNEMAQGLLKLMNIDIAVSVSGIAGPEGGSERKPVGTVCFGIAHEQTIQTFTRHFDGDREQVRLASCDFALDLLNEALDCY